MSINPLAVNINNYSNVANLGGVAKTMATPQETTPEVADNVTLSGSSAPTETKRPSSSNKEIKRSSSESAPKTEAEKAKAPTTETAVAPAPKQTETICGEEWNITGTRFNDPDGKDASDLANTIPDQRDRRNPLIAKGSEGDDDIRVSMGQDNGLIVTINGEATSYSADQLGRLVIDGGNGNDRIVVDKNVTVGLRITGGAGDDYIIGGSGNDIITDNYGSNYINGGAGNDIITAHGVDLQDGRGNTLEGGAGKDYLEGGDGRDIMDGGDDYDVLYGMGGNDVLHGGAGDDYLDGGEGDDEIYGDAGNDNLVGGKGNDVLKGGEGDDLLIGASGNDTIDGEGGINRIISSGSMDTISAGANDSVKTIETVPMTRYMGPMGKDKYEDERIESDLETLANTEQGQRMSKEIFDTGHNVDIRMTVGGSSCRSSEGNDEIGVGSDSTIYYAFNKLSLSAGEPWADRAPIVSLYHEMCHSYNAATGTLINAYYDDNGDWVSANQGGTKGSEYQAVGIPNPIIPPNPHELTENGIRELFGYKPREQYTYKPQ